MAPTCQDLATGCSVGGWDSALSQPWSLSPLTRNVEDFAFASLVGCGWQRWENGGGGKYWLF